MRGGGTPGPPGGGARDAQRGGVPGPRGGQAARALAGMLTDPLAACLRLAAGYGDAVRVPLTPGRSLFLLSRPEHAEHVLAANQDNYPKAFTYRPLRMLIGNGLLTAEGDAWRRQRRLIQPAFTRREVTGFAPHMTAAARRLTGRWDALPDGTVIDAAAGMRSLALEIAGLALFGTDLTADAAPLGRALSRGQELALLTALLPAGWGPRSAWLRKAVTGRGEGIDGPVRRMVAARQAAGSSGQQPGDLLDRLLHARDEDGTPLTGTEIRDELATFLLAGHETSAGTIAWSLALLSAYPAARQRLEQELDAVLGDRDPTADDLPRLDWARAVTMEALRLFPPAWTIERDALASDNVAGVPVPAGSLVVISPYLVHRQPACWPDPAGFDPGRFLPGGQGIRPSGTATPSSPSAGAAGPVSAPPSLSWKPSSPSPPSAGPTGSN